MACLSQENKTLYTAQLVQINLELPLMNAAILAGIKNGHISNYEFDSGEGKQKTSYRNVNEIIKARDALTRQQSWLMDALNCRGVINMGLKR